MVRRGVSSFGALLVIGLALAVAMLFLWRVWSYTRQISRGESITLPQYSGAFSAAKGGGGTASGARVDVATADDPMIGAADAKLTIVEFVDYECPFCNAESSIVRELIAKYQDKVRLIIRDFPVAELHDHAVEGAEAAGCAESQKKYWPMHDRLYAAAFDGELTRDDIDRAAEQSGLDLPIYRACMNMHIRLDEIQKDAADGVAAGVRGTPTFFFNGSRVEGAIPKDVFESLIRRYVTP